jgi:GNAT superfamily N-acetyltransferase
MPPRFSIRLATAEDAEAILSCLRLAFEPFRASYTPDAYRDTVPTLDAIHARLASMCVLVAVAPDGEIVGTVAAQRAGPNEGHLRGMAVRPGWQGAGVADRLLEAAERSIVDWNCARVSLDTTEPLQRAIRFYLRHGFRASGRVTDYFGMPLFEYLKILVPRA